MNSADNSEEPGAAVAALVESRAPFLIGVRHHSAALAASMEKLLGDFGPDALLIELPTQAQDWIQWLSSPETIAPIAFAGAGKDGYLAFYPFADFSPELVALRWARANNVPVICADAPMGSEPTGSEPVAEPELAAESIEIPASTSSTHKDVSTNSISGTDATHYAAALGDHASATREEMWEVLVEAPAAGATAEEIRAAALGIGWAHRADELSSQGLNPQDAYREKVMRKTLSDAAENYGRIAAVVGSFHAAALLEDAAGDEFSAEHSEITCSLVPYEFGQLDARSGYPSGVKDPAWQQGVFESSLDIEKLRDLSISVNTKVGRHLRKAGHPTGPAEVRESVRLALDLAYLRGNRAAGRREIQEGFSTVFAQGDVLGKGRAVARAAQEVLVGQRRGSIDPEAPRSGLALDLEKTMAEARLPFGPELMREAKVFDLDPLRLTATGNVSLDRTRQLVLARLEVAGILYGTQEAVTGIGGQSLTHRWKCQFIAATLATVEFAALRGVTLEQAASGALLAALAQEKLADGPTPSHVIAGLQASARASLTAAFNAYLEVAEQTFTLQASLQELLKLHEFIHSTLAGHIAVFEPQKFKRRLTKLSNNILTTATTALEGLRGSTELSDAWALGQLFSQLPTHPLRLIATVKSFKRTASPLIQGAAWGGLTTLGHDTPEDFSAELNGWIYSAGNSDQRKELTQRLKGVCLTSGALLETGNAVMTGLIGLVDQLSDKEFLDRVPALRGGFDALSPADRQRTLEAVKEHTGANAEQSTVDPRLIFAWATADQKAWEALESSGLRNGIAAINRWRLLLGREHQDMDGQGRRYARSLDELYGFGQGEGVAEDRAGRGGGVDEAGFPSARLWAKELEELFGSDVREEVLAESLARGRGDALHEVDPNSMVPSVELLGNVLNLAGALPESQLGPARALVRRIVDQLAKELADELRPTLHGIAGVRTTRRKTPRIDLPATIRANLSTATKTDTGWQIVPTHPVFKTLSSKSSSWDVIVLVDVSGSMEQSTIFAALTSAILAGVPALNVHFIAFNTQLVDLTEHVADPLALLLEVSIGGGTDIGKAMAYARSLVARPQKTLLAVVSDFEEGASVARLVNETAELASSGVALLGCAALDRSGVASYNASISAQLVSAGMPIAAVSPQGLTAWVAEVIKRHD